MSDTPHEDATVNEVPDSDLDDTDDGFEDPLVAEPPHPINWNLLNADDAEVEWLELNRWVDWLRHAYGLPASVIPPAWHTHPELLWELSALHLHWLCAYDPEQEGSAPLGWHRDFADARHVRFLEALKRRAHGTSSTVTILTTNYVVLFELAAGEVGVRIETGFDGPLRRQFDPAVFDLAGDTDFL